MNTINLFVTSREDPVPDLDSFEDYHQIKKWGEEVRPHTLKYRVFKGISMELIDELKDIEILECYAVVLYPEGKMIEGDNLIANELLNFLKENQVKLNWRLQETGRSAGRTAWKNFTYSLLKDPELGEGEFEVYLEVVTQ